MTKYKDYPFDIIAQAVAEKAAQGAHCYQKFTCFNCGQRLTMDVPNVLYKSGTCDRCGCETNIEKQGCNYMFHAMSDTAAFEDLFGGKK